MKIKSLFRYISVFSLFLTIILGVIVYRSVVRLDKAIEQNQKIGEIMERASHLGILAHEYSEKRLERSKLQWQITLKKIKPIFLALDGAGFEELSAQAQKELDGANENFNELVGLYAKGERLDEEHASLLDEFEGRLLTLLQLKVKNSLSHLFRLHHESNNEILVAESTNSLLSLVFMVFLLVFVAFLTVLVDKKIITPFGRIQMAARAFGGGDRGVLLPVNSKDEMGSLAKEFNQMVFDRGKVEEELIHSKEEAEKANNAKSEFLARMSHELRTPMNAILGFTQLLEMDSENALTSQQKENLKRVSFAGNHLLELINEVLDLSKVESGNMELSIERVDIAPIVDDVVSISKPSADEKGVSLKYQRVPEDSCFIEIDPLRFKQVVLNLTSNAIKYNKPNGSVVVSFEKQGNSMMRLGVRDTGHGIAEDKKDKLFKPFERFDADAEYIEGTGIGLTISQQLIELMNGTIGFESTAGEGSFFYIDVPRFPAIQVEEKAESAQLSLTNNNETKILYIEDIPANVELVKTVLNYRQEVRLLAASTALAGIELAQSEFPDLILMDIHLPDMGGLVAFKKLQTINETKDIPVIALTSDAMDVDIKKALAMGFKDYLTKPIDVPRFLEAIDKVLA
jgi:signal transduction histidine kinase/CheY-like chemotaxis protein